METPSPPPSQSPAETPVASTFPPDPTRIIGQDRSGIPYQTAEPRTTDLVIPLATEEPVSEQTRAPADAVEQEEKDSTALLVTTIVLMGVLCGLYAYGTYREYEKREREIAQEALKEQEEQEEALKEQEEQQEALEEQEEQQEQNAEEA
jgi:uncharacterized protein HemX